MKNGYRLMALGLVAATGLAGCGARDNFKEHRNPEVSDLTVSAATIPESTAVTIPVPMKAPAPAPKRAEAASLWKRDNAGFFGDRRAVNVGDILTIMIEIDDEAELRNASQRSRSSGNEVSGSTVLGYESKLDNILPGLSSDDLPTGSIVDLSGASSSRGNGTINRQERIRLKVAAMVIEVLANGNMVIAGRQEVKVNNELRELRIAGIIRPVDIDQNNAIPYDRIAEARITYGGRGQLSRVQQPRYGEDALDVVLPY